MFGKHLLGDTKFEKFIFILVFLYPLTVVPQLLNIWVRHSVEGVSLLTWVGYLLFSIPLLIYSIIKKIRPYIIMYILFMTLYVGVVVGLLVYR